MTGACPMAGSRSPGGSQPFTGPRDTEAGPAAGLPPLLLFGWGTCSACSGAPFSAPLPACVGSWTHGLMGPACRPVDHEGRVSPRLADPGVRTKGASLWTDPGRSSQRRSSGHRCGSPQALIGWTLLAPGRGVCGFPAGIERVQERGTRTRARSHVQACTAEHRATCNHVRA